MLFSRQELGRRKLPVVCVRAHMCAVVVEGEEICQEQPQKTKQANKKKKHAWSPRPAPGPSTPNHRKNMKDGQKKPVEPALNRAQKQKRNNYWKTSPPPNKETHNGTCRRKERTTLQGP